MGEPLLADVDHDGRDEVILPGTTTYDGKLEVWEFEDGQWSVRMEAGGANDDPVFHSAALTDLGGDGIPDIVVGTSDRLHAYAPDGSLTWTSPMVVGYVRTLLVGNIDADPGDELVAVEHDDLVWIFDAETATLEAQIQGDWIDAEIITRGPHRPGILLLADDAGLMASWGYADLAYAPLGVHTLGGAGAMAGISQPLPGKIAVGRGGGCRSSTCLVRSLWESEPIGSSLGANTVIVPGTERSSPARRSACSATGGDDEVVRVP